MGRSKIEFRLERILFPKSGVLELGSYSIIACQLVKLLEGEEIQTNKQYGNFSLLSYTPILFNGFDVYKAEVESEETKYGISYKLVQLEKDSEELSQGDKMAFLEAVFTPLQLSNLLFEYKDPYTLIAKKDTEALIKVKGIGLKSIQSIYKKFDSNLKYQKLFSALSDYKLTKSIMDSLLERYGSPEIAIKKVKENVYVLSSEVNGIGFKRCDALALSTGMKPNDQRRIKAFMEFWLYQEGENGNSWVNPQPFLKGLSGNLGVNLTNEEIREALYSLHEEGIIWWNEEKTQMGLKYYRSLEEKIYQNIKRLQNAKNNPYQRDRGYEKKIIEQCEKEVGYEFTDEQIAAFDEILNNNVSLLTGSAGCVDKDTEFFNGETWKPISEYNGKEKVLQYNTENKSASLVFPLRYIKEPCDKMYRFKSKYGVDQCLSPEHRVLYVDWKRPDKILETTAEEMKNRHLNSVSGFGGKIPVTFSYSGEGMALSDSEIKLMCAVICDGSFYTKGKIANTNACRFHLKKECKKDRLREIIKECGLDYREKSSTAPGYTDFYVAAPLKIKEFTSEWYNCSQRQLQLICDNILFWDGSVNTTKNNTVRRRFSTTVKASADFVQFAFSSCGYKSTIQTNDRRGRIRTVNGREYITTSIEYEVIISERQFVSIGNFHRGNPQKDKAVQDFVPLDGYKYCFTVPSHALVLRRNGQIFITGNCGKSTMIRLIASLYKSKGYTPCLCTLSGKAAARIFEATNFEGSTIHRALGYNPQFGKFTFDEENPLPNQLIIVDETSFVGGELFLSLLKAIQDGARLVLVGDEKQLPAIGACNIFFDMINSNKVKVNRLTKIHRQAAKSGIILASKDIREGKQIAKNGWYGVETRGELQDFTIDVYEDRIFSRPKLMDYYKHFVKTLDDAEETQIILATKTKGDCNTFDINNEIQDYLNPKSSLKSEILMQRNGKEFAIREGDRVINRKNDYKATVYNENSLNFDEEETSEVFNGFCGVVRKIENNKVIVKFDLVDQLIEFSYDKIKNLELSYALTVHLFQGSQVKRVIYLIDNSSYIMNTRELVYTAITRASEECFLLAQSQALKHAIVTSQTMNKQTYLQQLLMQD